MLLIWKSENVDGDDDDVAQLMVGRTDDDRSSGINTCATQDSASKIQFNKAIISGLDLAAGGATTDDDDDATAASAAAGSDAAAAPPFIIWSYNLIIIIGQRDCSPALSTTRRSTVRDRRSSCTQPKE